MTTDTTTTTPLLQFLRAMPKVEIHCHLLGAVRHSTFMDLVRAAALRTHAAGVPMPLTEQEANAFIEYVQSAKRVDADTPIEVPGDAERRYRVQRAQALPLDTGTLRTLDEAALAINKLRGSALPPASSLIAH